MNIESDHFETLEELMDTIKMWVKNEEEFYDRWFGLNEMNILVNEIKRLNNIIIELSEKNRNLLEDNMRLRKELNLHSGKLYISDIEVKNVF